MKRLVELNNNLAFLEQSKTIAIDLGKGKGIANIVSSLSSYDISLGI
jgi:hypothetical protein